MEPTSNKPKNAEDKVAGFFFGPLTPEEVAQSMIDGSKPTIRETDFFYTWLGLLSGKQGKPEDLMHWLNVAGSVHQRVKVIDDEGNVLYEVPALAHTVTSRDSNAKVTLLTIIRHTTQLSVAGRQAQAQDIFRKYTEKFLVLEMDARRELEEWNAIFNRYEATRDLVIDIDSLYDPNAPSWRDNKQTTPTAAESQMDLDLGDDDLPPMDL